MGLIRDPKGQGGRGRGGNTCSAGFQRYETVRKNEDRLPSCLLTPGSRSFFLTLSGLEVYQASKLVADSLGSPTAAADTFRALLLCLMGRPSRV